MHITPSPQRRDDRLQLSKSGDVLTINGLALDLSGIPEGATLPASAVDCEWLAAPITVTAEDKAATALDTAKAAGRAQLTAYISAARAALITVLPGQDMIYLAKEAEALAWVAAEAPAIPDFPLLAAEVGITAPDADQLAQLWLNLAQIWRQAAAVLEANRLSCSAAIQAATTPAEVATALIPIPPFSWG